MAALPYMQLYVADYLADTMHLTTEQHGAYLLLLFNYWQRGKALPDRKEYLATVARLSSERWQNVEDALKEFFVVKDGFWKHPRVEADLDHMASKQEKAAIAGRASAQSRKRKNQIKSNVRSTDVKTDVSTDVSTERQLGGNHSDTYTDPYADTDKKPKNSLAMLVDMGVEKQLAQEWLKVRKTKRLAPTKTAFEKVQKEASKAGMTMNEAVTKLVEESWGGFNADWVKSKSPENDYMKGMK